jgi:hypothetical protein
MKSNLKKFAFVPVLLLVFVASFAAAQETLHAHKLTKSEVNALIVGAKTPADHLMLAAHFREEASEEATKAEYHEEMAKLYAANSNDKHNMAEHCKHFADEARNAAASDNQLATEHEKMAEEARQAK